MPVPVLFFGCARTGSSFILNTLRSDPSVLAHGEPFQTENLGWHFDPLVLPLLDLSERDKDPYEFVRWLFRNSFGRQYVMLKILLGQNDTALRRLLEDNDIRKVYLRRPNRLAHHASFCLAYKTNVWNAHRGENFDHEAKTVFDPEEFRRFATWQDNWDQGVEKIFKKRGTHGFICDYEPARLGEIARNVAAWLGMDTSKITDWTLVRMYDNRVIDRFSNPDAVLSTLREMGKLAWIEE